jgi:hypothetical protein
MRVHRQIVTRDPQKTQAEYSTGSTDIGLAQRNVTTVKRSDIIRYVCSKAQVCAKCAKEGHSQRNARKRWQSVNFAKDRMNHLARAARVLHATLAEK